VGRQGPSGHVFTILLWESVMNPPNMLYICLRYVLDMS
jgi:hypothetical protein